MAANVRHDSRVHLILGDPRQLEQPMQGSHPEGTDVSALATSPNLTGSSPTAKTIGIVEVAALAAWAPRREPGVAITATRRRMSSSMSDGKRLYWPSSQ